MAHDANFAGDRLRLASFPACGGDGHAAASLTIQATPPIDEQPQTFSSASDDINTESSLLDKNTGPFASKISAPSLHSPTNTVEVVVRAPGGSRILLGDVNQAPEEPDVHDDFANDSLHPQMPTEPHLSPNIDNSGHAADDSQGSLPPYVKPLPIKKTGKKARSARVFKPKETSHKPRRTSCIRNRRLRVNGLALLRTTTLGGLPEPSDANTIFAAPVTHIDPIEDNQVTSLITFGKLHVQCRHNRAISKQRSRPSPQKAQEYRKSQITIAQPTKYPAKVHRPLQVPSSSREHLALGAISDGFVGSELDYVLKKRSRQRGKTAPVERDIAVNKGLALAIGLLPIPAIENLDAPVSMERFSSPNFGYAHAARVTGHSPGMTRQVQLSVASNQSVGENEKKIEDWTQHGDRTIRNQLSSITAPLRRVSESSESESPAEESSCSDESDSDSDNCDASSSRSVSLVSSPGCADTTSYFDYVMHHPHRTDLAESVDEEFWSQYNAID